MSGAGAWVVSAEVLDNVVFDKRACEPTIYREIAVSTRAVGAGVGNRSNRGVLIC